MEFRYIGNIKLDDRPNVKNKDGSISTVRSIGIHDSRLNKEVNIPTVINGKIVSNQEAVNHYKKTGQHLGIYNDISTANEAAKSLHEQEAKRIENRGNYMGRESLYLESGSNRQAAAPVEDPSERLKRMMKQRLNDLQDPEVIENRRLESYNQLVSRNDAILSDPNSTQEMKDMANKNLDEAALGGSDNVSNSTNQYDTASKGLAMAGQVSQRGGAGEPVSMGLSGAAVGASVGGPYGAAVGAAVGVTGGLMAQRARRKKEAAENQAKMFENTAKIEEDTETKRQNAITNMVTALRSAFLG